MVRSVKFLIFITFLLIGIRAVDYLPPAGAQAKVDFKRDIEPIFAAHCYQCHGAKKASGQLRLDLKGSAMRGGISGKALMPGAAADSMLVKRILGEGGQARMPMGADPLSEAQIRMIRQWIDQGAVWTDAPDVAAPAKDAEISKHWAYVKPVQKALPPVFKKDWVRNPIDRFILSRLEKEGLEPSGEAEKATLLRRLYLDLTGLPPTVREVDEFLADKSDDAYEQVVDRLLASPHYGERWARPWLDLARYADSNGYEKDNIRTAWKFRDWVIDAFNADMPFDQFTIEQIAGDMLPNPTENQRIATGFHRNTMVNQEGGIDPEENRFEILADRVNTTSTVWLGNTLGCAQCHNHKYDPLTQKDYYRMMAFFDNAEYQVAYQTAGEDSSRYISEPQLNLPTPEQDAKRKVLDDEIRQLEAKLKTQTPELALEQARWERGLLLEQKQWSVLNPLKSESTGGASLNLLEDGSILVSGHKSEYDTYLVTAKTDLRNLTAIRIEALPDESLPKGGPGRDPYGNFLVTGIELEIGALASAKPQSIVLKDVFVDDSAYRIEKKEFFSTKPVNTATDRPAGWFVNATGDQMRLPRQAVFVAEKPFNPAGTLSIRMKYLGGSLNQGIGRFRISVTNSLDPRKVVSIPARLRPVLSIPIEKRTEKQKTDLAAQFRATTPLLKRDRDRLDQLRTDLRSLGIVSALVMQERPVYDRPFTYIRERGSFLNKGEKVYAATPAVLHPMPESAQMNRLGLARWIVDENNPLTSRVTANRFWEQIFGHGIVETSEDFGSQGERPVNQELLDWLAVEFIKPVDKGGMGWSVKKLVKMMVTSSAYRQSSAATPALIDKDPYNRLLARGPRFRMEAEMVRDMALAVSGLLSAKVGGKSVFPLQPEGVWKAPYSGEKWVTSKGEDAYRRTLYTFIRRSSPFPMMLTFDATSREACTVRRVRTNTPLQALTLLNDESAMENARALAKRASEEAEGDLRSQLTYAFRLCISRMPQNRELDRLMDLHKQQLAYFNEHPDEALKVTKTKDAGNDTAQIAAWTMVANVLLNLDETITRQ
jgi:mono/diheme cytochrome c family protein